MSTLLCLVSLNLSQLTMDIAVVTLFIVAVTLLLGTSQLSGDKIKFHHNYQSNVRAVAIVTRHGERTPLSPYPGDLNGQYFDQIGYGQLIPSGCRRMHKVGLLLKHRFPAIKRPARTVLKSSSSARCVDTLKCLVDGIDGRAINFDSRPSMSSNSLAIQMATDPNADVLLNHAALRCPLLWSQLFANLDDSQIPARHATLWSNLSLATGRSYLNIHTVLHDILDSIVTEHEMALPLPSWVTPEFVDESYSAINGGFNSLVRCDIEAMLTGVFLADLVDNLQNLPSDGPKLIIYSTHDTTLSPIMYTVGAWSGRRPNYGESLVFVLHSTGQLEMFYLTSGFKLKQKTPPGCTKFNCSLKDFAKFVAKLKPDDWRAECSIN